MDATHACKQMARIRSIPMWTAAQPGWASCKMIGGLIMAAGGWKGLTDDLRGEGHGPVGGEKKAPGCL